MSKTIILLLLLFNCSSSIETTNTEAIERTSESEQTNLNQAYLASGCFWCVEAIYESIDGVTEVISGYAGGHKDKPTYEEVGSGTTGHAETVKIIYDPAIIDFRTLIQVYYATQDPTTIGQKPDYGDPYRSIIFYSTDEEKEIAEEEKEKVKNSNKYQDPIVTEIKSIKKFWKAEDYHQDYERLNPDHSYIVNVSKPRLEKFKSKFPQLLNKQH